MNTRSSNPPRRDFLKTMAVAGAGLVLAGPGSAEDRPAPKAGIKLGLDNFAVRAMNWKAAALLDYAASLKLDSILISDLDAFDNFEETYLKGLRAKAADLGLQIHLGTWSICPT